MLLTLLRSAAYEDDQPFAVFAEVHAVTGSKIDPALVNARSNTPDVRNIAQREPVQRSRDLPRGFRVQAVEPFAERAWFRSWYWRTSTMDDGNIYITI